MDRARAEGLVGNAAGADLILAEGSMGLFDGVAIPGASGNGASADMAVMMGWPVVLVLDVSGAAQSVAATALGFSRMRPNMPFAGVILNRVASPRHEALVRVGMDAVGIKVLGALPRRSEIALPERHLGLVQAGEQENLPEILAEAAAFVSENVDITALRAAAATTLSAAPAPAKVTPPGQRIALARDKSRIARRHAGRRRKFSHRATEIRPNGPCARGMWRLYGDGRGAGRQGRHAPPDGGPAGA